MIRFQEDKKIVKYKTTPIKEAKELIEKVEVQHETDFSVYIDGFRFNKACDSHHFHDSYQQALQHLLEEAEAGRSEAKSKLIKAVNFYHRVLYLVSIEDKFKELEEL